MFWIGLAITVVGGLIGIPLVREWILSIVREWLQPSAGHDINGIFDFIRVGMIIIGAIVTTLSYIRSQNEKRVMKESLRTMEYDLYRIREFDVDISIVDLNGTEFHSYPSYSEEM
jgi:hypothetical protein